MEIVRIKNSRYVVMCNTALTDKRLDIKTRGVYATIMSLPDNWDFSINGLVSILPDGKRAIMSAIDKLKELGYCSVNREFENGRVSKFRYTFYETPLCEKQQLQTELIHDAPQYNINNIIKDSSLHSESNNIINNKKINNNIDSSLRSESYSIAHATEDLITDSEIRQFTILWNAKLPTLKINRITKIRRDKLKVRLLEIKEQGGEPIETLRELINCIARSKFLQGDNNTGFKGSIDWVIKNETNFTKVLEGKYDDTTTTNKSNSVIDDREEQNAKLRENIATRLFS